MGVHLMMRVMDVLLTVQEMYVWLVERTLTNGIASNGCFQPTLGGNYDGYIVKFDSSGQRQWGTYYGGTNFDQAYSCAIG